MHQIYFNRLKKTKFDINHGWHHYWDEPFEKKQFLKEYVKGPFTKTVLMFSDPYVTLHQQDRNGDPVKIKKGIPDPWAEYLIFNYLLHNNNFQSDKMYKEDLNVVNTLRKRYRLYLGQGIPDPCLIHPYIISPEFANNQYLLSKGGKCDCSSQNKNFNLKSCKKKHCFCCEKKYLFECPDKWDGNFNRLKCSCPNCHGRNWEEPDDTELCEVCTRVHYYDETELPKTIKNIKKQSDTRQDSNKISATSEDIPKEPKAESIESQTRKNAELDVQIDAAKSSGNQQMIAKTDSSEKTFTVQSRERKMRICCCPYIKSSNHRKVSDLQKKHNQVGVQETQIPSVTLAIATSTKEIQTDPTKYSKQVQTDQSNRKLCKSISYHRKCECTSKCPFCCLIQCRKPVPNCLNTIPSNFDDIIQFQKCPLNKEHRSHCSSCCVNVLRSMLDARTLNGMQNRNCKEKLNRVKCKKERQSNSLQNYSKLKANGKLYCCTFSSGFSGKCMNNLSKTLNDKTEKFDKESFNKTANNRFVYHCTPNSVSSKVTDYFSTRTFDLNPSTKPSFYYELKPATKNLIDLRSPFEKQPDDGLKNFRSFQKSNRLKTLLSPVENSGAMNYTRRKEANAPVPLEVKYVKDLKSDESKTYGLINAKKRRKGRKLRSIVYKKSSSKNSKAQIFKAPKKLRKSQKAVNVESCALSFHQMKGRKTKE